MRRLAMLSVCLLALVPAFDVASAAGQQGHRRALLDLDDLRWRLGQARSRPARSSSLYANFIWKTPATPRSGSSRIEWHDPAGALRARWKDKTIKADKKGTRLYAWIGSGVVKGKAGSVEGSAHRRRQGDQHQQVHAS